MKHAKIFSRATVLLLGLALAPSTLSEPAAPPVFAESAGDSVEEYLLKAAFLYNFANFTTWPDDAFEDERSPLVFAVLGEDPFDEHLIATLDEKHINGRPLKLVNYAELEELGDCHLLFVSRSEAAHVAQLHTLLADRAVFTVSDIDRYAHMGGVARLGIEEQRPVMEINTSAAKRADLQISSQLLKLARVIEDDT
ncbi:MAG: hypothetical protein DHS20C15_06770 [Planctomycetota bacterium]|nr:MAG: hypothetical protein DHS20C15_06770 [Planctomycetota bacterium]